MEQVQISADVERIEVTREQLQRIDAAWTICAYGNERKAIGGWSRNFRECVAEVIGREPSGSFTFVVAEAA